MSKRKSIQSNLYITALYIAVTLYITITSWTTFSQLPYIFCKVDLFIAVTLSITVTTQV